MGVTRSDCRFRHGLLCASFFRRTSPRARARHSCFTARSGRSCPMACCRSTDPAQWPVDLPPARQLRMAYQTREQWQRRWPNALDRIDHALGLLDWLQSADARQPQDVRDWLACLDPQKVAAELVAAGVNVI